MRKEKQLLLDDVKDQVENANAFVVFRYEGVDANTFNAFRGEVEKAGGHVEMLRKRLLIKAGKDLGFEFTEDSLPGHIGVVFSGGDAITTTKVVFKFNKDVSQGINVIGGRFDGKVYSGSQVQVLSELPGKDEMRAQLLGLFEAPMAQTLSVMESLIASVVYCLDNKVKLENGESA